MTTTPARQPQGIPAGGQFAPSVHGEPDVSLAATARKNQSWHDLAGELTADGRSLDEAKTGLAAVLALNTSQALVTNAREHLGAGYEASAAMFTIAASTLRDLPSALESSKSDGTAARDAVTAARKRLKSAGSLLDMTHPTGRQPVFKGTDDILADLEDFLTAD